MITTEEQNKLKEFFADRIKKMESAEHLCKSMLLLGSSHNGRQKTLREMFSERPDLAIAYTMAQRLVETFKIMDSLTENMLTINSRFLAVDTALENLSKTTNTDLSDVKVAVNDLEKNILPSVKAMVQLFDKINAEEKKRKKNGEVMIA